MPGHVRSLRRQTQPGTALRFRRGQRTGEIEADEMILNGWDYRSQCFAPSLYPVREAPCCQHYVLA